MAFDEDHGNRYISGGIYYNSSYNCCVGFSIGANCRSLTVSEIQCTGYASVVCRGVAGIKY